MQLEKGTLPGPGQENGASELSQPSGCSLTARQVGQLTEKIKGPLGAGAQVRAALKQSGYAANFLLSPECPLEAVHLAHVHSLREEMRCAYKFNCALP